MKRPTAVWLFLMCLFCLLSACGAEEKAETGWSEVQMAQAVWTAQGAGEFQTISFGDSAFASYVSDYYQLDPGQVAGGAVLYAGGVSARETAVLHLADGVDAAKAEQALKDYIDVRAGAFAGYAPEEYAILERSGTARKGQYVALLIGPDLQAAEEAFAACFTTDPPEEEALSAPAAPAEEVSLPAPDPIQETDPPVLEPEPTQAEPEPEEPIPDSPEPEPVPEPEPEPVPAPEPWQYDQNRIAEAWRSGNRDGLAEEDLAILVVCGQIPALTDSELSVYERELALHDWMLDWAEYDPGALSNDPVGDPMPHNDDPYGFLTGRKGICLGYAATFQLLMELSGFECITVRGTSHAGTADHAWNLVKLEDEWYCVDVTWDDPVASFPVPRSIAHLYFNVTSDFLREHDHQWDGASVPEATAAALAWAGD